MKPADFQTLVTNNKGRGQPIAVRKGIKHHELDVTRWSSDNIHNLGPTVELGEQPVRNIVNIYACNQYMKEQDLLVLDDLQNTLPGDTLLCGDFNAIEVNSGATP